MKQSLSTDQVQKAFPTFTEPELQRTIAEEGQVLHFEVGQVIVEYGSYVKMLPLIISGTIKISRLSEDGSELFLYYLRSGETCIMTFSCFQTDKKSEIKAVVEENAIILGLAYKYMDSWMMRYQSWKDFVLASYSERMMELVKTIDQVTFHQLDKRLIEYLRKRTEYLRDNTIYATHQAIAQDLHVSREAISRVLKGMEKRGLLTLGRNEITVSVD